MANNRYRPVQNPISYLGAVLALVSFFIIVITLIVTAFGPPASPYMGLLTYLVLPVVLVAGLILIPIGIVLNHRRIRKAVAAGGEAPPPFPILNLNDPRQRRGIALFSVATVLIIAILGGASYGAAEYMDSTAFCGQLCHTVMQPEFVAHNNSPHARVNCVNCHIGPGAPGFVQSKLSGVRQVIAVIFNTYSRPIPVPVTELRPARDTCEQCHWPAKFTGDEQIQRAEFQEDEANTPQTISFTLKTGSGGEVLGVGRGIHWHADDNNIIEYIATDQALQKIPWVRVTLPDGTVTTYIDKTAPLSQQQIASSQIHRMDCIDCHNRPTHTFEPPDIAVDAAMANGLIATDLPFIKKEGVAAVTHKYPTTQAAMTGIANAVTSYYEKNYPDVAKTRQQDIKNAISALQNAYSNNVFPDMNVQWNTYVNNIGHINSPGCFRCHDGNHVSDTGQVVPADCNFCHTIPVTTPGLPSPEAPGQTGVLASGSSQTQTSTTTTAVPVTTHQSEPASHLQATWITSHGTQDLEACKSCHTPDFCANQNCHGVSWLGRQFNHPWPLEGAHAQVQCATCHKPNAWPSTDCKSCHTDTLPASAPMSSLNCDQCHTKPGSVQPVADCKSCHADVPTKGLHAVSAHTNATCQTCHQPHTWTLTSRDTCTACHQDHVNHNPGILCTQCHSFTQ